MNKPFLHLNIPFKVKDTWKDLFPNLKDKQYVGIYPPDYLEQETLDFFESIGLDPYFANIWSWLKLTPSIWHIDQRDAGEPTIAFNFLLMGDAGITEWIDFDKVECIEPAGLDPTYGTKDVRFVSKYAPDFAASIKPGYLMMIRNDIPHRVNRREQQDVRWTLRLSLKKKNSNNPLTWDEALEIFKDYTLAE